MNCNLSRRRLAVGIGLGVVTLLVLVAGESVRRDVVVARVVIYWKADLGNGLQGELENLSGSPLTDVRVEAQMETAVVRSGFVVGRRLVAVPPGRVEWSDGRLHTYEHNGGVGVRTISSPTIPAGERGYFVLQGPNQVTLRNVRVVGKITGQGRLGDGTETEITHTSVIEPR